MNNMRDASLDAEDIIAEPEELEGYISIALRLLHAYGWYIIAAVFGVYFYYKNRISKRSSSAGVGNAAPKTTEEIQAWQLKEEQRLKAVQRLQEKYAQDSAVKAEKQKKFDEEKRNAKLEEMQKLTGKIDVGQKVGGAGGDNKKTKSLRSEYNPLMGDQGSSSRVCFRRPGGGSGG